PKKVPVVLSHREMKLVLKLTDRMLEKVLFGFIYDTGLRIDELTNLLIGDVDLDRAQVHVRCAKGNKERYVTMSSHAVRGIKKHLALHNPATYLFESPTRKGIPICKSRIRRKLHEAVEKAGIRKQVCVHTLRHTYATHQVEAGQNIMAIKEAMGHGDIRTTLIYMHIANLEFPKRFGCLETLYKTNNG
ncbi:integrase, partial [Marinilabiliaceae bacterium JC017]